MATRGRGQRSRALPPSPIATGKGLRSAAINDALFTEYLDESLRVPHLTLPESFPLKSSLKVPPVIYFHSLVDGDNYAARQVLVAAKEDGVLHVSGGGEMLAGEARAVIEVGREVFATPAADRTKGELGQEWFGRRNGIGEEFYWHRFRSPETERLLQLTWPDSYLDLRDKMDTVSSTLQIVAESIAKILSEQFKNQTPSKRIGKIQSILCLRKYESYSSQSGAREWSEPKSHSDALNLHISGDDHEFCIRYPQGSAIFMMPAGDILVTFGKPLQEWSNGALKSASADALHQPTDDQFVSFSLEYMCTPLVSSHDPDNGTATITLTDQLLIVLVFAVLYILWSLVF